MAARKANRFRALLALFALLAIAGAAAAAETRVPLPHLVPALGERCVEDTDFMRRNHMKLLKHQRDETVHQGIRTEQYSLKNCLSCHAAEQKAAGGEMPGFCQSCHVYAGVRIDCFECHATTPEVQRQVTPR